MFSAHLTWRLYTGVESDVLSVCRLYSLYSRVYTELGLRRIWPQSSQHSPELTLNIQLTEARGQQLIEIQF